VIDVDKILQVWKPLPHDHIVRIRSGVAGRNGGALARVVERHDDRMDGYARYTVQLIPCARSSAAPYGGHDPAGQYAGSRLDVVRYELATNTTQEDRSIARVDGKRKPKEYVEDASRWAFANRAHQMANP
jgi:hypothetical protein